MLCPDLHASDLEEYNRELAALQLMLCGFIGLLFWNFLGSGL